MPRVPRSVTGEERGINRLQLESHAVDLPPLPPEDPARGLTRIEVHEPDVLAGDMSKQGRGPDERANRIELDGPDPLSRGPPARAERGVNRVEVMDSPLHLPETWSAAKGGAGAKRVEIPHEIDSLLGIKDDEHREDEAERGSAGTLGRVRPTVVDGTLTSSTRSHVVSQAEPPSATNKQKPHVSDDSKANEGHAEQTPASTPPVMPRNGTAHPAIQRQGPDQPTPLPPKTHTPRESVHEPKAWLPFQDPPASTPDMPSGRGEPALERQEAAKKPTSVVESPNARSKPAPETVETSPKEVSQATVPMGVDSVADGKGSPTITAATTEPTPAAAEGRKKKQKTVEKKKAVVGSRTGKWLSWFLGNPAHVESVITPVSELEPNTTQVTLREMVPATAYARVLFNTDRGRHHYVVIEPPLDEREIRSLQFIKEVLLRTLDIELEIVERSVAAESLHLLDERVRKVVRDYRMDLSQTSLRRLVYYLRRDFTGYGPVDVMMHDPDIEDISCDGPGTNVFLYHRRYGSMESNVMFATSDELDGFVIRMAQRSGKQITIADPLLDSSLPDGSRLQATLGREVTDNGSTFTIRRFRDNPLSPIDLVRMGTMSADLLAYCWIVVQFGANVMLAGGTASGKTTTLNTISLFIPRQAKIVSIEDTREINLPHKNWVRSVTRGGTRGNDQKRVDMFDLLTAALRQRPEYILVGEVRGKEATVAFQAMATGHTVLGTIHADSPRSVVYRLESEPINIPRIVIQSLDVILMQALLNVNGRRQRRIQEVAEIVGIDPASKELLTHGVFLRNPTNDQLHYTGRSYKLQRIAQRNNWSGKDLETEMKRRAQIITALVGMPHVTFDQIGQLFSTYENRPDAVEAELERLRTGIPNGGAK